MRAGGLLADSTAALVEAVREEAPEAQALLLVYLPSALNAAAPELKRANVPLGWAAPAFDVLQVEDYDWVTGGQRAHSAARGRRLRRGLVIRWGRSIIWPGS